LNIIAYKEQTATIEQAEGRPGKSAPTTAAQITITNETFRMQRINGAILCNDSKACFNRLIEKICHLILRSEGQHINIIKLHCEI
jgi:hypothetical protein